VNNFGKLRRCTDHDGAIVTLRRLIQKARQTYRWEGRPTTRRLK